MEEGIFGKASSIEDRIKIPPGRWWQFYGAETPELQRFAIRVLSQGSSASPCERNWSSFNHIQTKKRNRLLSSRLEDLVYVRNNLHLALSSLAKDSSSSYRPWFEPIPSVEEDFGIDGDSDDVDEPHDDGVPYIDDYEDHNSSAFSTPCALDDLELYDITSRPQE